VARSRTGAISILETAADAGIEVCFANPGTTEMPLVAALDAVPRIRAVLSLFEGVCTGAADGYARLSGKPALTLLHLGPGFANGIANLHNARRARSPIVNLIGDQASWHLAADAPLTSDIHSLATPVSAWVRTAASAEAMPEDIADAIAVATGPPGKIATYILPADYQAEETTSTAPARRQADPSVPPGNVESVAKRLRAAGQDGLLLLGGRGLSERGLRAAARISESTGARLRVETFPAVWERGGNVTPVDRLAYFPEQARADLASARTVALAGAAAPVAFFGYPGQPSLLAPDGSIAELASPLDDAEQALDDLADAVGNALGNSLGNSLGNEGRGEKRNSPALPDAPSGPLDSATIGAALARCLPENAIVMDESATSGLPFYAMSAGAAPHTLMALTGGAIGQGLPVATGAALACPDRKVIAFQADGSAAYTLQALWTQAREGLDIVTLLCANRAYRILQVELARAGIAEPGPQARSLTQLDGPPLDWVSLAHGLGVPATRVETAEELLEALPRALAEPGPQLIEMLIG
jgi:acetolactate synthase-1/2/3 large subunit